MSKRDEELTRFVRDGLAQGIARSELRRILLQAGWSAEHIDSALASYAEVDFALPVPTPRQYISAQEAFLYLVLFTTLYITAYGLGSLAFEFIEQAFPDALDQAYNSESAVRRAMAMVVVALPIFLFTTYLVRRLLLGDPTKIGSPTRKWLTYIALFIAVGCLIGDLVTLVYKALGGELTPRFLLKVATVAILSGGILSYYLHDLKRDEQQE